MYRGLQLNIQIRLSYDIVQHGAHQFTDRTSLASAEAGVLPYTNPKVESDTQLDKSSHLFLDYSYLS